MIAHAIAVAAGVHEHQYDKGGEPYILHCIRVMETVRSRLRNTGTAIEYIDRVCTAAVMHDVIEDNEVYTPEVLTRMIGQEFGTNVLNDVIALTRLDGEDYLESYIPRVAKHSEGAVMIKMADLEDNLQPLRQPKLRDKDLQRLQKYHMAYRMLRGGDDE